MLLPIENRRGVAACTKIHEVNLGAGERTRTSMGLLPPAPKAGASAISPPRHNRGMQTTQRVPRVFLPRTHLSLRGVAPAGQSPASRRVFFNKAVIKEHYKYIVSMMGMRSKAASALRR